MAPGSILFALVALLPGFETSQYCARFEFPDLPDQTVTVAEDSYITIPFRLVFEPFTPHQATPTTTTTIATSTGSGSKNQKCLRKEAFLVLVTRAGKGEHSSRPPMDYCVLRVSRSGHCLSFSRQRRCVCHGGRRIWEEAAKGGGEGGGGGGVGGGGGGGGGDGGGDGGDGGGTSDGGGLALLFTRKVRREDEGLWWWWTQEEVAAPAEVFLKVSDHIATTVTTAATTAITTTNANNTATTTSNINNNRSSSSRIKAEKLDTGTQGDQSAYDNDDEDEEDSDDGSKAPMVNVSHITAMVAGVNIFTIFIIGIVVLAVWHLRCSKRGRGRPRPAPPLCQRKATGEQRHYDAAAVSSAGEKRLSTSSRLYDEISDDVTTLINSDTSLYLHPISCNTDTTTVPVITFATITNAK